MSTITVTVTKEIKTVDNRSIAKRPKVTTMRNPKKTVYTRPLDKGVTKRTTATKTRSPKRKKKTVSSKRKSR